MGFSKAGDKGPQVRACDPVEKARPQNPCAEAAFSGDHQYAACALPGLPAQETPKFAARAVLGMPVKIKAGVDGMLSATDAPLTGKILRRAPATRRRRQRRRGRSGAYRCGRRPVRTLIIPDDCLDDLARRRPHGACDL